ncbi:hypothetical protein J2W51_000324 [Tardiphaga robiniae]|uniref:hypothetical protein n=1 Tax=Tardiphaga robiniae TaxID=943830 RepID=UPI00285589CC|nr:hypothetical protein [Tardiphaga robiniae]MDR6657782.1 hypothetical protein [Tardiphaga robiniae]
MIRLATIGVAGIWGYVFSRWMSFDLLQEITQPLIVAISIMAAALLVRLNRGMPTLDWQSLEVADRKLLTQRIVELSQEYMFVLAIEFATLLLLLLISVTAGSEVRELPYASEITLGLLGAMLGLSVSRMAYIVWRDTDIIRLQKKLIDDSADRQAIEKASREAITTAASIRAAGLKDPSKPEVTSWPDSSQQQ